MRLRERNKAATRDLIAEVAARLFFEEGYDEVTLERVADECGTSIRTVLRYFDSKDQLALAEHYQALERFRAGLHDSDRAVDVLSFWRDHVADAARLLESRRDWWFRHFAQINSVPTLSARFLSVQRAYEDLLAQAMADEAGLARPDLPQRVLAAMLVVGNLAAARDWTEHHAEGDLEQQAVSVVDFVIASAKRAGDLLPRH